MANSISHAALPFPVKNARFTLLFGYVTAFGIPTDPTTPDTEYSSDGGQTFAELTEEVTTGGAAGVGFVTLTGAETNNSAIAVQAKSANCVTSRAFVIPRALPILESGTATAGATGSITLAVGASARDLSGCIIRTTGGTGGGGGGGANNQARVITAYNTSTRVATVVPNWETTPDSTTTYDVLLTDQGSNAILANVVASTGYRVMGYGTVTTGASTTSVPTSACFPAGSVADQFKDRVMIFTDDTTTAALRGVAKTISASSNAAAPTFTVGTLPATPASGDVFVIV